MPAASINSASLWANQISALSAQCAAQASALSAAAGNAAATSAASGGLFGDLVSALTRGAVTVNSPAPGTSVSPASSSPSVSGSSAGRSQIAQDLQAFTQSLLQALASNQAAQPHSGGFANTASAGIVGPSAASASRGVSSAATSASIANLNTTFNRLMHDLNVSTSSGTAGSTGNAAGGSTNAVSRPNPGAVLPRLMQAMVQHLQQQGAMAASVGHAVHVVA